MPNYQNGKIYKLVSFQTDKIYIGSTCQNLSMRKAEHKKKYKLFLTGKYHNISSFELIKLGDVDIILLENCPCENKEQLHKRERYFIETLNNCVNKHIPTRTGKEYREQNKEQIKEKKKIYAEQNKEKLKELHKEYYETNKEDLKEKMQEYYEANKEKIQAYKKEYRKANIEKIKEKAQNMITCNCGAKLTFGNRLRHQKTKKHLEALKNL
jgi:hypothetical protein